jgi:hypothetical protein
MKRMSIGFFAEHILQKPLYPYQIEAGDAILESVFSNAGRTYTIMMSRQSGKNQLSAVLEAYLLVCMKEGTIVKAAPTFSPQVITSRLRLLSMLDNPLTCDRVWRSFGYIVGVATTPELRDAHAGPRIMFFSAGPEARIVGATASLLLEVDEAQDVAIDKFDRELRPMASTTNATTVLYGTAWSDDTLLAIMRANSLALEERDGIKRHFEHDWRTLAAINGHYKKFVEGEIARLGSDHPTIRTQYRLLPISGAGYLLNEMQRYLLGGGHDWEEEPDDEDDGIYVAGIDVGGEERPHSSNGGARTGHVSTSPHDSTVITVGKVRYNEFQLPKIEVVHHYCFTGMRHSEQYAAICEIVQRWNIRRLVIDATGLGEALASLLIDRFGDKRVSAFKFSRPSKSRLTYQFLSMVNSGRLKIYRRDEAPAAIYSECWKQLELARYRVPAQDLLEMYCAGEEANDDFLMSIALCCEATRDFIPAVQEVAIIKPRRLYENEGRF